MIRAFEYIIAASIATAATIAWPWDSSFMPIDLVERESSIQAGRLSVSLPPGHPDFFAIADNPLENLPLADGEEVSVKLVLRADADLSALSSESRSILDRANSFLIRSHGLSITVIGADVQGLLYGVDHLGNLLHDNEGTVDFEQILDAPDHEVRALHIVLRFLSAVEIRKLIEMARAARFNTLIMELTNQIQFESRAVTPSPTAITKKEFRDIVEYARASGLEVIPQVVLLTHQPKFFGNSHPELMYNKQTYDPRKPEVYELVFEHLNEVIELTDAKALHIGHDEVAGTNNARKSQKFRDSGQILPADLFLDDVLKLHKFLTDKDIEVWMWGDMLMSPEEFPGMKSANFHGNFGHSAIRKQIPTDIVICDWHYWDNGSEFPSAQAFADEGYDVLGSTWKKERTIASFSLYVAQMPRNARGMIATTWSHVQKREWTVVEEIIQNSGEAFWRAE